jgi:hypothetical protein
VREEDAGGREAGARESVRCLLVLNSVTSAVDTPARPLYLKMPLENGRADERVSRGQASERAACVCEAESVEQGARRPPLPTAVVCPPGPAAAGAPP